MISNKFVKILFSVICTQMVSTSAMSTIGTKTAVGCFSILGSGLAGLGLWLGKKDYQREQVRLENEKKDAERKQEEVQRRNDEDEIRNLEDALPSGFKEVAHDIAGGACGEGELSRYGKISLCHRHYYQNTMRKLLDIAHEYAESEDQCEKIATQSLAVDYENLNWSSINQAANSQAVFDMAFEGVYRKCESSLEACKERARNNGNDQRTIEERKKVGLLAAKRYLDMR